MVDYKSDPSSSYFWIGDENIVHIVESVKASESPSGNDASTYVSCCRIEMESWRMAGMPDFHWINEKDIKKLNKIVCPECIKACGKK